MKRSELHPTDFSQNETTREFCSIDELKARNISMITSFYDDVERSLNSDKRQTRDGTHKEFPRDVANATSAKNEGRKTDYGACVICINDESRLALVPCGHVCLCEMCAAEFKAKFDLCPICKQIYTATLKIYLGGAGCV